jgi:two-component system, chemotaxis family, chemotaxis protein CheY
MRILIADDEKKFADLLAIMVGNAGHEVASVVTSGGLGAMQAYSECAPDVVLMDFMMPQYNGVTATRQILSKDPGARVVVISGMPDTVKLEWAASEAGAMGVLKKPFTQEELEDLLAVLPYASPHRQGPVAGASSPVPGQTPHGDRSMRSNR